MTATLQDRCAEHLADHAHDESTHRRMALQRAFMTGAEAALSLATQPGGIERLRAEVIGFGRVIGSPVEAL